MFEIKKDIPVSVSPRSGGGNTIYPFAMMEVGDCFDAPDDMGHGKNGSSNRQSTLSATSRNYVKRHNPTAKFTTRHLREEGIVRCWRIA